MTSRALKKRCNKREKRKRKRKEEAEANATANDEEDDEAVVLEIQMLEEAERQVQNRMWEERERQAQLLWEQHRKDAEEEQQKRVQEQSVPVLKDDTTTPHTGRPLSPQQQLLLSEKTNAYPRLYSEGHSPELRNSASPRGLHSEEYGTEKVRRSSPYFETSSLP